MPSRIYDCSCNRSEDTSCRPNSCIHSTAEEATTAEESLLIYCKPVELYNILHSRALENPSFLQRCLRYKIQAKHKRRLQMTVSLLSTMTEGIQAQNMFPLYILLAKPVLDTPLIVNTAVYHLIRACMMDSSSEIEGKSQAEANLILPDINKLSLDAKAGKLIILLVSLGGSENVMRTSEPPKGNVGGYCLWGKISMESLCMSLERRTNLIMGLRTEMLFDVDMRSCFMQPCNFQEGSSITIQTRWNCGTMQVQVSITAKVIGSSEKSPKKSFPCNHVPTTSLSNIIRFRAGNVIFNYRDINNMLRKTEVTEDFSCPFCLVQCACFKGLRYHLISSHDLFNFDFWVTDEYQAVNVSVKIDILRSQTIANGVDPKLVTFFFRSKSCKRRKTKEFVQNSKHVYPLSLESGSPKAIREGENACISFPRNKELQNDKTADDNDHCTPATNCMALVASSFNIMGVPVPMPLSSLDTECIPSVSGSDPAVPTTLTCAKSRKLFLDRSDSKNRLLLQKRQFFHSHRAQPMALDQVLSDKDSEDEADHDIADFEDRRMLDDFVDVSKDEKRLMHLWNSFVRKQRVLADGHVPWACEAFSKLHGQDLVRAPALFWCWRLFMIKLWNHGLLDACTMNACNIILEEYRTSMQ